MKNSIFKILFLILSIPVLNSCAVGDLTDLWPSGSDENQEVVIRELPGESFDPEDTEEVEIVVSGDESNNDDIAID